MEGSSNGGNMHCHGQTLNDLEVENGAVITIKYLKKNNDTVGELYFGLNDQELKKVIDSISFDNDQKYKFAVSMQMEKESVKLLQ